MGEVSSDEESTELPLLALGKALDWLMWRDRLARRRTFRVSQGTPCCFEVSSYIHVLVGYLSGLSDSYESEDLIWVIREFAVLFKVSDCLLHFFWDFNIRNSKFHSNQ